MKLETDRDATEWVYAAKALAVVSAYMELGIFAKLAAGPVRVSELGLDARAALTTLPVLRHVGLVAGDADVVTLTPAGRRALEAGDLPTGRNLEALRDLSRMKDVLLHGGPVVGDDGKSKGTTGGTRADDPAATARFLDMLYASSESAAATTFAWLSPMLAARSRVLDLGGGHGRYLRVFADAGHHGTLFDLPHVVTYARGRHGDAIDYVEGDFHESPLGGPYDLALLSNIIHGEGDAEVERLLGRLAAALAPGGRVAIKDMFLDEQAAGPANAAFFGLTMLFMTRAGRSPSFAQLRGWLAAAGFGPPQVILLETHSLVVAQKA
ncbi:MAG: methyltransferase domain-containing protein [Myxococcales bacterium]|nr:methyltransferase domain-containing protein [Myxococcales bacterium]